MRASFPGRTPSPRTSPTCQPLNSLVFGDLLRLPQLRSGLHDNTCTSLLRSRQELEEHAHKGPWAELPCSPPMDTTEEERSLTRGRGPGCRTGLS